MQITKFGHSCVLLDDGQTKILFDPGAWSEVPDLTVDAIVITHTHQDHLNSEVIQRITKNAPTRVITNTEVGAELSKNGIEFEVVEDGANAEVGTFKLEAAGNNHATIHSSLPVVQNTGYIVNETIYHPGDSLFIPSRPISLLFLPVVAPWSKVGETIDYILAMKPKTCFPIHDAFLNDSGKGLFNRLAGMGCQKVEAELIEPELGKTYDF